MYPVVAGQEQVEQEVEEVRGDSRQDRTRDRLRAPLWVDLRQLSKLAVLHLNSRSERTGRNTLSMRSK